MHKRVYILIIICITCFIQKVHAQEPVWVSPFSKLPDHSEFKNYYAALSFSDEENVYFAINKSKFNHYISIYQFNGVSLKTIFNDTSGSLQIYPSDLFLKYKNEFYIVTRRYKGTGSRDGGESLYKWNGKAWESLVSSMHYDNNWYGVATAFVYKNEIYMGGGFDSINDIYANHIIKYNGSKFSPVEFNQSTGISHYSYLIHCNDTVYVFGDGKYSGFTGDKLLWNDKNIGFSYFERFIRNNQLYIVPSNEDKLYKVEQEKIIFTGTVLPGGKQNTISSITYFNDNLFVFVDSLVKNFWDDYAHPKGLGFYNSNNNWSFPSGGICTKKGIYNYYTAPKFFTYKNKLYAFGLIDTINFKNDSLRFIVQYKPNTAWISGMAYNDNNINCILDKSEVGLKNQLIKIEPGPLYTNTDDQGKFKLKLNTGHYSISAVNKGNMSSDKCKEVYEIDIVNSDSFNNIDFGLHHPNYDDFSILIRAETGGRARRGFTEVYEVTVRNNGGKKRMSKVMFTVPESVKDFYSSQTLYQVNHNTYEWLTDSLVPGMESRLRFQVRIDTGAHHFYDKLYFAGNVYCGVVEPNMINNYDTLYQCVVGSFDPNMKQVWPYQNDSITILRPNTKDIEYTIHFENLGTDTAYKVTVFDTISTSLDIDSIVQTGLSHAAKLSVIPCTPDIGKCILSWSFNNIKLAPNHNGSDKDKTDSRGSLTFRVKMKEGMKVGEQITNKASIYFDFNEKIVTNTTLIRVDTTGAVGANIGLNNVGFNKNEAAIFPNPTNGIINIQWNSEKPKVLFLIDLNGRIVKTFNVFQSTQQLNISEVENGFYMVKTENGEMIGKIVKNN